MARDAPWTVLIVTHELDDHVGLVEPHLTARGVRVARVDTERAADDPAALTFAAGSPPGGAPSTLAARGGPVATADVSAVLFRHLKQAAAPGVDDPQARRLVESERRAALEGTLLSLDARWVNHPHANRLARHKPLQLAEAERLGLTVPETVVTADPARIRALFAAWDGRMVAKLVGGQLGADDPYDLFVVHTTLLTAADLADDDALAVCPAIYQRCLAKALDVRVTVVGDAVFGCAIDADADAGADVDWRTRGVDGVEPRAHAVDPAVARAARALVRRFGLEVAGLDFVVDADGRWVFLELNAAGQWAWVERATGLPIAEAIADRLTAPARAAAA